MKDDEGSDPRLDPDLAAIRRRRASFTVSTVAGLALPLAVVGCPEPRPCLNVVQVEPHQVGTETTTPSASAPVVEATSAPAPATDFAVTPEEAGRFGLPAIGVALSYRKAGGWSVHGPSATEYFGSSGSPGGPQRFLIRPYEDKPGAKDLQPLFVEALKDHSGLEPIVVGAVESVTVGGMKLVAQSFRTGKSLATTVYCVAKLPSTKDPKRGALLIFGVGSNQQTPPDCKAALERDVFTEILATIRLSP
jgi:hypothetical protein